MAFKMRSGNKPGFKNIGSSPTKQLMDEKEQGKNMEAYRKAQLSSNTPEEGPYLTKQKIKQDAKTSKVEARGKTSPGGRKVTKSEKNKIKKTKLVEQHKRATALEAAGKGEKGFSWKKAGKTILQGGGILDAVAAGIGTGRDKSAIIKDRQTKLAGKEERGIERDRQKAENKALRIAKREARRKKQSKKIRDVSDLSADIV